MEAKDWIQLAITLTTMLVGGLVFYFKNLEVIRKELTESESRIRSELGGRIDGLDSRLSSRIDALRDDVHRLDVTVARLEERFPRSEERSRRLSESPAE